MKVIHLFDCDGVILNSNGIKNEAFHTIAKEYDHPNPLEFYQWCSQNNGITRQVKLKKLQDQIFKKIDNIELLIDKYSKLVYEKLLLSELTPKLNIIKEMDLSKEIGWGIISGGSQVEILSVLSHKGVDNLFNLGIYGNPKSKAEIFNEFFEFQKNDTKFVYFGDSKYDYEFACTMGLNFVFVSDWSNSVEFFCNKKNITKVNKLHEYWRI